MNSLSATDYQSDGSHASTVVPALGFLIIHSNKNDTLKDLINNPMGKNVDDQKAVLSKIQSEWAGQRAQYKDLKLQFGILPPGVTDDHFNSFCAGYKTLVNSKTFEEKKAVILNSEHCLVLFSDVLPACQVQITSHVRNQRVQQEAVRNGDENNIPKCQACYTANVDCSHANKWYQLPNVKVSKAKPPTPGNPGNPPATPTTWYEWIKEVLQWMFTWIKAPLSWASLPKFPQRPNFPEMGIPTCLDKMSAIIGLLVSIAAGLFAYRNKSHTATKNKPVPAGWMSSIICFIIAMVIAFVIASAWMGEALD